MEGKVKKEMKKEKIGEEKEGNKVYMRDIWN